MRIITRCMKWGAGLALVWTMGSVPGCASMGGGGMRYLLDPPLVTSAVG